MKRIKYYVIHCTSEERDRGIEHYERFDEKELAIKRAKQIDIDSERKEFIVVEKHNEKWVRNDWLPDWDMGDNWFENIEIN